MHCLVVDAVGVRVSSGVDVWLGPCIGPVGERCRVVEVWKVHLLSCWDLMILSIGECVNVGNGANGLAPGAHLEGLGVSHVSIVFPVPAGPVRVL